MKANELLGQLLKGAAKRTNVHYDLLPDLLQI